MINTVTADLHAEPEWTRWPSDIGQRAVAVIDTTRWEWVSRSKASPATEGSVENSIQFAHPLIRIATDAVRSRSGRMRRALARARRRPSGRFSI